MNGAIVPLPAAQLANVAPNWSAMRTAIATCERLDEVRSLSDKAVALRAYFAQSRDVDNEVAAMRIRLRAERRLGELIAAEQEAGRLAKVGDFHGNGSVSSTSTHQTLSDLGIPRDRSARAQELARVPEAQFEAALHSPRPSASKLASLAPPRGAEQQRKEQAPAIDVQPVLKTWGAIRDFAAAITDGTLLVPDGWNKHPGIQQFQVAEIRTSLPIIVDYLSQIAMGEK